MTHLCPYAVSFQIGNRWRIDIDIFVKFLIEIFLLLTRKMRNSFWLKPTAIGCRMYNIGVNSSSVFFFLQKYHNDRFSSCESISFSRSLRFCIDIRNQWIEMSFVAYRRHRKVCKFLQGSVNRFRRYHLKVESINLERIRLPIRTLHFEWICMRSREHRVKKKYPFLM